MFPNPQMIRWRIFKPIRDALGLDLDSAHTSIFEVAKLCEEQIKQHEANLDEDNITDYIDAYLVEMKKHENDLQSSFYKERGHYYLVNSLIDMFFAGMETTSSSLNWTFLILLHHPEIKRKLQTEIDKVQTLLPNYYFDVH